MHIYGHPVDMDPLLALAENNGLRVIEDAAEAHGAAGRVAAVAGLDHPVDGQAVAVVV